MPKLTWRQEMTKRRHWSWIRKRIWSEKCRHDFLEKGSQWIQYNWEEKYEKRKGRSCWGERGPCLRLDFVTSEPRQHKVNIFVPLKWLPLYVLTGQSGQRNPEYLTFRQDIMLSFTNLLKSNLCQGSDLDDVLITNDQGRILILMQAKNTFWISDVWLPEGIS